MPDLIRTAQSYAAGGSTPRMLDVIALFPNCTACGRPLSVCDARVELDPVRPQRARHTDCATPPLA